MSSRAHMGENHGIRLARLETALDTLTLALIAAAGVLLMGLL